MSDRREATAARAIRQIKARRRHNTSHIARQERDMARFMDFHDDLKLPAAAIAPIAEDARNARTGQLGVRQIDLYHNAAGTVCCLLEGPDEEAIRQHHVAMTACAGSDPYFGLLREFCDPSRLVIWLAGIGPACVAGFRAACA